MENHVDGSEIRHILRQYSSLQYDKDTSRIRCSLSGHEMPCNMDAINSYLKGKKFQMLQAKQEFDYENYKPHIVPSTKKHQLNQLFCMLTLRHINKTPSHVERHISGGKYKRALARWEECQRNGTVYKQQRGRKKQQDQALPRNFKGRDEVDDSDEGSDSDADSLSDLYPAMDLQVSDEEQEGSDYDMGTMDVDDGHKPSGHKTPAAAATGGKRKVQKSMGKQHKKNQPSIKKKQKVG